MLDCYYQEMITAVQRMRNDHLRDLEEECQKSFKEATIGQEDLKMHMVDLDRIWEDIEGNLPQIIEEVDHINYENCMNEYRKTTIFCRHKLDEYEEGMEGFTTYNQADLNRKITIFEDQLLEPWNQENHAQNV